MDRKAFFQRIKSSGQGAVFAEEGLGGTPDFQGKKTLNRRTNTGTSAYTGTFGKAELMHLLRRTLFGVKVS